MPSAYESDLSQYLESDERLLWTGKPRAGFRLRRQDAYLIPFSLLWCGFVIFWEFGALKATAHSRNPAGSIFPLFGIPFVAIGLYMFIGRFFADARIRAKTVYGVTDERIVILSGLFSQQVKSLQLRTLSDVSFTQSSDGSGTITFGSAVFTGFMIYPGGSLPNQRPGPPAFEMIEGVKEVYEIIRKAQKAAR